MTTKLDYILRRCDAFERRANAKRPWDVRPRHFSKDGSTAACGRDRMDKHPHTDVPGRTTCVPCLRVLRGQEGEKRADAEKKLFLWKLNKVTGYWVQERDVMAETAKQWLGVFKKDDPTAEFKVSSRRPN